MCDSISNRLWFTERFWFCHNETQLLGELFHRFSNYRSLCVGLDRQWLWAHCLLYGIIVGTSARQPQIIPRQESCYFALPSEWSEFLRSKRTRSAACAAHANGSSRSTQLSWVLSLLLANMAFRVCTLVWVSLLLLRLATKCWVVAVPTNPLDRCRERLLPLATNTLRS